MAIASISAIPRRDMFKLLTPLFAIAAVFTLSACATCPFQKKADSCCSAHSKQACDSSKKSCDKPGKKKDKKSGCCS